MCKFIDRSCHILASRHTVAILHCHTYNHLVLFLGSTVTISFIFWTFRRQKLHIFDNRFSRPKPSSLMGLEDRRSITVSCCIFGDWALRKMVTSAPENPSRLRRAHGSHAQLNMNKNIIFGCWIKTSFLLAFVFIYPESSVSPFLLPIERRQGSFHFVLIYDSWQDLVAYFTWITNLSKESKPSKECPM